jgi:tRNA1(Val) A37 N6-methylase TrmN6
LWDDDDDPAEEVPPPPVTVDAFLDGRVEAVQPAAGHHRSGLDTVLLAAAVGAGASGTLIDLGAGAGVAGLCVAARARGIEVTLVEREPLLLRCAADALARPANAAFAGRVRLAGLDLAAGERERLAAGLAREAADQVIMNPPFHRPDTVSVSAMSARADAHVLPESGLEPWFRFAAWALRPNGALTVIFRADGLAGLLAGFGDRFGTLTVLPVHPRPGQAAHRVLIRGRKGSRGPLSILPGLPLHEEGGRSFLPPIERMLRDGADLAEVLPPWRS